MLELLNLHRRNQTKISIVVTILITVIFITYSYIRSQGGGAGGITIPLILYILYISIIHGIRLGSLAALVVWGAVTIWFIQPIGLKFNGIIATSFVWAFILVLFGVYIRNVRIKQDEEIRRHDLYSTTAAHEMRTPLAVLKLRADLIRKDNPALAQIIDKEVIRMVDMIDRMLSYAKLKTGKYELKYSAFFLRDVVHDVIKRMEQIYNNHEIVTVIPSKLVPIEADQHAVEEIITNLLNNAVKHGTGKEIFLTFKWYNGWVRIQVTNTGGFIPLEIQPHIFEPFSRADNSTQGLGIGLFVTKQLTELHGGRIAFLSNKRRTTFTVELPTRRKISN